MKVLLLASFLKWEFLEFRKFLFPQDIYLKQELVRANFSYFFKT